MTAQVIELPQRGQRPNILNRTHGTQHTSQAHSVPTTVEAQRELRDTFGQLPSGVCVITTDGAQGPHGMTASSVCSLSLDPPLLLVCVDNRSATLRAIAAHGTFAVNVLAAGQADTSTLFASREAQRDKFTRTRTRWRDALGVPVLNDVTAWLICELHELLPGGDHTIVVGRVRDTGRGTDAPLVWQASNYRTLQTA